MAFDGANGGELDAAVAVAHLDVIRPRAGSDDDGIRIMRLNRYNWAIFDDPDFTPRQNGTKRSQEIVGIHVSVAWKVDVAVGAFRKLPAPHDREIDGHAGLRAQFLDERGILAHALDSQIPPHRGLFEFPSRR